MTAFTDNQIENIAAVAYRQASDEKYPDVIFPVAGDSIVHRTMLEWHILFTRHVLRIASKVEPAELTQEEKDAQFIRDQINNFKTFKVEDTIAKKLIAEDQFTIVLRDAIKYAREEKK